MEEIWKEIPGFYNYQISNKSRVKSIARIKYKKYNGKYNGLIVPQNYPEKILTPRINNAGYFGVHLYNDGKMKTFSIHRLVCLAFLPNPERKETINHIDGNKQNNALSNLEWATIQENLGHAKRTGLSTWHKGEQCHNSRLTTDDVITIRALSKNLKVPTKILSSMYGVCVDRVVSGKTWKQVQ